VGTPLWLPIDDRRSALVDGVTGGWVLCTNDVRGRIDDGWDRVVDPSLDQTFELLWRRGLVRIGGIGVFDGIDVANAIEASRERYTLVLLLSTGCNLACSYCYLGHRLPTDDVAMPVETALSAVDAALAKPWPEVMLDFGEVAVSRGRFEYIAHEAIARAEAQGKRLRIAIQTNGTAINATMADLLASLDAVVGLSLDGPPDIHDAARTFRSGAGSYERVVRALGLLKERGVAVHLIATIGSHNVARPVDVLDELASHDTQSFLLKPVLSEGEARQAWEDKGVTAAEHSQFMVAAVRYAAVRGLQYLDQSATKFLDRLIGDRNGWRDSCTSRYCGSGRSLHVVDPTGHTHACPRFVDEPQPTATVQVAFKPRGTTAPHHWRPSLGDLLPTSLRTPPVDCGGCPWLSSCGGGCTLISRRNGAPDVPQPDPHCLSYDSVHAELLTRVLPAYIDGVNREATAFNGARVRRLEPEPA